MRYPCFGFARAEIVEQKMIGLIGERFIEFVHGADFDLDWQLRGGARVGDCARDTACRRDVIVLDQDGVVETHAVVGGASAAEAAFFEFAKAGGSLARVENLQCVWATVPRKRGRGWLLRTGVGGNSALCVPLRGVGGRCRAPLLWGCWAGGFSIFVVEVNFPVDFGQDRCACEVSDSRVRKTPVACVSGRTQAFVVTSPAPMSSARARWMIGFTRDFPGPLQLGLVFRPLARIESTTFCGACRETLRR